MDAFATYPINQGFQKNDYMVWHVCTQAQNRGKVELKDDSKVYFSATKNDPGTNLQHLAQGGDFYQGGRNLRVEVTVYNSTGLDASVNVFGITTRGGDNIGAGYNICVEDGEDKDFNDFFISLLAWRKQG